MDVLKFKRLGRSSRRSPVRAFANLLNGLADTLERLLLELVHEYWVQDLDNVAWSEDLLVELGGILLVADEEQLRPLLRQLVLQLFEVRAELETDEVDDETLYSVLLRHDVLAFGHAKRLWFSLLRLEMLAHEVLQPGARSRLLGIGHHGVS